jgi:uncharacterized protein (TIGR02271 family)
MAKSVVGLFDERTNIDAVIRDLDRIGVPKRHVHALGRADASEKGGRSFTSRVAAFFGFTGQERERELGAAYADAMNEGDTLLIVDVEDAMADPTAAVLNQYGAIDLDARTAAREKREEREIPAPPESRTVPITSPAGSRTAPSTVQTTVPVVQEELEVGKRTVERGGVRVHSHVEEMPVEEVVRLREEHVNVERRPVDRPLSGTDAFKEVTVEVTETAEEPVVAKQARVVEEVIIDKQAEEREETIEDTVRRQEVEVEPLPKTGTGGRR